MSPMSEADELRAMVDRRADRVRALEDHIEITVPHVVVSGDEATGRSYALQIRWDAGTGRFWVFRVSANTWRWVRTPQGWRIAERVNAPPLDGTPGHREMLAPPAVPSRPDSRRSGR